MIRYIDIHSHIQFPVFDEDREGVLARMREGGVGALAVGCDLESSKKAIELANANSDIWASIGVHPTDKREEGFDVKDYEPLFGARTVAVGECGLDYFRKDGTDEAEVKRQHELFEAQVTFALEKNLPLMIHCRPSKGTMDAYDDLLRVLKNYKKEAGERLRGNIHFFAGDLRIAKEFLELGFTLSFTGVITFATEYDEVIKQTPLDMLLPETDCPYVTPTPHRGERNESAFVPLVVSKIAAIRGEDEFVVAEALLENAHRVFGISTDAPSV